VAGPRLVALAAEPVNDARDTALAIGNEGQHRRPAGRPALQRGQPFGLGAFEAVVDGQFVGRKAGIAFADDDGFRG